MLTPAWVQEETLKGLRSSLTFLKRMGGEIGPLERAYYERLALERKTAEQEAANATYIGQVVSVSVEDGMPTLTYADGRVVKIHGVEDPDY